jgi:hypothetical protein
MIHATYLEDDERRKLELFQTISARCDELQRAQPKNVNGHYFQAYALGRYSQGISVLKALTDGLGGRIKAALEASLRLGPETRRGAHRAGCLPCRGGGQDGRHGRQADLWREP